jgi:hypothetical protein
MGQEVSLNSSMAQKEKKFFDIEYIFEEPIAIKRRRYLVEPKTATNRSTDKNYRTLEPKADMSTSVILKDVDNLLKIEPVKEKQLLHLQKTDLSFNKDSKRNIIHAQK